MVHFILSALASEVTLDLSASIPVDASMSLDVSAVAIQYISQDNIKAIFKYQTDSADTIDASSSDLKYYVDYSTFDGLDINPANAVLSSGEITDVGITGVTLNSNKKMVAHDYLRFLAEDLFGTHFGVDIFNNEKAVIQSIRSVCGNSTSGCTWYDIKAAIKKVSTTSTETNLTGMATDDNNLKYLTNEANGTTNLCRVLMRQMLGSAPSRFADIGDEDADGLRSLPFEVGDIIGFKLIINAAENQHLITRSTDPVPKRSYEIQWVIANTSNTAVASDEL
jgi:hypothetical protein